MARSNTTPITTTKTSEATAPSYDDLLALVRTQADQIARLHDDVTMLCRETHRIERHLMIGVNPNLIDREKA